MKIIILQKKRIVIFILITVLIAMYHFTPVSDIVPSIRTPFSSTGSAIYSFGQYIQTWTIGVIHASSTAKKINTYEKEIAKLRILSQSTKNSEKPNKPPIVDQFSGNIVNAKILAYNTTAGVRSLLIDKGQEHGVRVGTGVGTSEGIFVGKIIYTDKKFSLILPVTDSESIVASTLANDKNVQSITRGVRGVSLNMDLIPQDSEINKNDIVVTSILEENTPIGLILGTVETVEYLEGELFKHASITPVLKLSLLSDVLVFIPVQQ